MNTMTLQPFCNVNVDIRYAFYAKSPLTFILSSGYSIIDFEEPIQVALIEVLSKYNINWLQYIYPERSYKNSFQDLYISTGLFTLNEIHKWVQKQTKGPISLFGISFGGNISIELALEKEISTLIIVNAVFDYVQFRTKQLGEKAMRDWQNKLVTELPYENKSIPLGYRFIQEAENQSLEERAHNINCAVYAFQGDEDQIISPSHIQRLADSRNNWKAYIVDGADHAFNKEDAINNFIREIEPVIRSMSDSATSS
ncbi:MAG TPA: YqiA/YcfP family alpha/beta fold hydrolase [Herpetosiphonaceae bacterium]